MLYNQVVVIFRVNVKYIKKRFKTLPHFYVEPQNISNNAFIMGAESAHYLFSVRRFKEGDVINIFDGLGASYSAQITKISKTSVEGKIISKHPFVMPKRKINLYTSVPKGDRFEWLVEKAAELGVTKLVPLITQRSISDKQSLPFSKNKIVRLHKISTAASSQCGRADIMQIAAPTGFQNAINTEGLKIVALETEEQNSLFKIITQETLTETINIFIGPEGGFTPLEAEATKNADAICVTLGKNILRVETAAIVCAALTINIAGQLC